MEPSVEQGRMQELRQQLGSAAPATAPSPQTAADAVEALERTIEHFESVLGTLEQRAAQPDASPEELANIRRELGEVLYRVEDGLGRLTTAAQSLAEEASGLAQVSGRLEGRLGDLAASLDGGGVVPLHAEQPATPSFADVQHAQEQQPEPELVRPQDPVFWQSDQPIGIVIAGVPGFQGLMDLQRGIGTLPAIEGASVVGYKNGEASLEVALRQPVSAYDIVEGLRVTTGHQLVIEEARPEALRLRLRFVDAQAGMVSGGSLRAELRSGSSLIG